MNLSERDKKLLLILAAVAIICVPTFIIIQPTHERSLIIRSEIQNLQNRKKDLINMGLNESFYKEEAERLATGKEEILALFPSELPQEASILFADNTEKLLPVDLYQMTLGEELVLPIGAEGQPNQAVAAVNTEKDTASSPEDVASSVENTASSEVIQDSEEIVALGGGQSGIVNEQKFTFEAGYQEFKKLLNYVNTYRDRMIISDITATYMGEAEAVTGNFTIRQYAVSGADRLPVKILEPPIMQGTTNVFRQAAGIGTAGTQEEEAGDFFLMLSQPEADVEAKIVGRSNDASQESYLMSDDNSEQDIKITFEGSGGQYNANYKIGKQTLSEEGISFVKNNEIIFEVISSPRVGEEDKVSAKLNVINNTDVTVRVKVLDDDKEAPRVTITGKTGVIVIE